MKRRTITLLVTSLAMLAAITGSAQDQLAIRGGRIIPIVGTPIEDGVILIRDGRITAIGKDIDLPIEAKVIEAKGKVIMPGFVDVHSAEAMSQANERNPNVPYVSVVDTIDPSRSYFEECRRNGITTASVVPGNSTMIGGQAAIVKTAGKYVDQMLLKRHAGLKISLEPQGSDSRMNHLASLRKELDEARRRVEQKDQPNGEEIKEAVAEETAETSDSGEAQPESSSPSGSSQADSKDWTAMMQLVQGEQSAFIYCDNAMDVRQALRMVNDYKLKAILVLGRETYEAVDLVAESKLPVVLDAQLVYWKTDPRTNEDQKIVLPKIFREKQIPFALQTASSSATALGNNYLWFQAATAVKYGVPRDEALEAITLLPAKTLGIDNLVGSIEVGKDADLVILSGDPLDINSWVDFTIINGQIAYDRSQDTKLQKLLQPTSE